MPVELKDLLNKKTVVRTTIGTLMAASAGVWVAAGEFNELKSKVATNSVGVKEGNIRMVNIELALAQKEAREIRRELRRNPDDHDLLADKDAVDDNVARLTALKACLLDPNILVCGQ